MGVFPVMKFSPSTKLPLYHEIGTIPYTEVVSNSGPLFSVKVSSEGLVSDTGGPLQVVFY